MYSMYKAEGYKKVVLLMVIYFVQKVLIIFI